MPQDEYVMSMDVPDLVRAQLGDEDIQAGVSLGDEDVVCFTPTRTVVYRGDGLLSDEAVAEYSHDFERLAVSEGRRKTRYTLTYVDREDDFSVPGKRTDAVLERLIEGTLRVDDVIESTERVTGVFRFSELTLVVTEGRLLKHVGENTWDDDFEVSSFEDVTGLHFEDGSVATAVVLEANGRRERIKAPNEQAGALRKTLESAVFTYFDVGSLDELHRHIAVESDEQNDDTDARHAGGFEFESGIDPLVSDSSDTDETVSQRARDESGDSTADSSVDASATGSIAQLDAATTTRATTPNAADLAEVTDQLSTLTATIDRQNELLTQQQQTIEQLIEELRRGR